MLLANSIEERVNNISSIIFENPDSAAYLAQELMDDALNSGEEYGIVQSNFILAYIHDKIKLDYGKAIIYYLEAIRYAEKSSYSRADKDLAALFKNCGVIFRKFKSYSLAEEYYEKASKYASTLEDNKEFLSIRFNTSGLMMDQKRYNDAVVILNNLIANADLNSKNYWKYNNRLGLAHYESGQYELAIEAHSKSLYYANISEELKAYTLHNVGRCLSKLSDYDQAISYFNQALEIKKGLEDKSLLFSTYSELGELKLKSGGYKESLDYFNLAEVYVDQVDNVKNFELFKLKANALFKINEYHQAKKYEDLYSDRMNKYLDLQEKIQESDRRYNMDLITKRYFDEVAKQERIASILFYSKLISGSLLALLLFSIGYNWYQKVRLRRSIVKELVNLKVID